MQSPQTHLCCCSLRQKARLELPTKCPLLKVVKAQLIVVANTTKIGGYYNKKSLQLVQTALNGTPTFRYAKATCTVWRENFKVRPGKINIVNAKPRPEFSLKNMKARNP